MKVDGSSRVISVELDTEFMGSISLFDFMYALAAKEGVHTEQVYLTIGGKEYPYITELMLVADLDFVVKITSGGPRVVRAPPKASRLPAACADVPVSTAPLYLLSDLENWATRGDTEALGDFCRSAFKHGHFFVEMDGMAHEALCREGLSLASRFFDGDAKRGMQSEYGTWGWSPVPSKRKEMMKVRNVTSCRAGWVPHAVGSAVGAGSELTWEEVMRVRALYAQPSTVIARAVLLGVGIPVADVQRILEDPLAMSKAQPSSEFAASFFSFFRYNLFDFSTDAEVAVPAEEHQDVNIITVTHASSLGHGLQAYDWEDGWVCMEGRRTNSGAQNCLGVLLGSCLEDLSRGRRHTTAGTPHRVVLANNAALQEAEPRHSLIFSVLADPDAELPLDTSEKGHQLYTRRRGGVSSINVEQAA